MSFKGQGMAGETAGVIRGTSRHAAGLGGKASEM